ncbi:DUF58 domain-containing protein [Polycladidibacter stylochi]|uniref:DUF58 domain-containing protein n=1 Tax=Polycladidibacter stylochi TaxID=1807766 RepID=UPI0008321230|nr:DUF58 domain-containing protein [Pseudovibrio stylochi]
MVSRSPVDDPRISVSFRGLIALENAAKRLRKSFSFRPSGMFAGRHRSKIRGQGLDFEELRPFRQGDTLKQVDWKASSRVGKRVVKVFSEETDRPALVVVNMKASMLFGSQTQTKAVVAAQAAAFIAFLLADHGDRVGGLVLRDDGVDSYKPNRTRSGLLRFLRGVSQANRQLVTDVVKDQQGPLIRDVINQALALSGSNGTIAIITDSYGFTSVEVDLLRTHSMSHNIMVFVVSDPLEVSYAQAKGLVVSDGTFQFRLQDNDEEEALYRQAMAEDVTRLRDAVKLSGLPFGILYSNETCDKQMRHLLMGGVG